MTTRITAKYRTEGKLHSVTKTVLHDVDDETGRLIGLGLLFAADFIPEDAIVDVEIERSPGPRGDAQAGKEWCPPLDSIVTAAGDVGVRALAAAANVPEFRVRLAIEEPRKTRERLVSEVDAHDVTIKQRDLIEDQLEQVLRLLGWEGELCGRMGDGTAAMASDLLAKHWVRREPRRDSTASADDTVALARNLLCDEFGLRSPWGGIYHAASAAVRKHRELNVALAAAGKRMAQVFAEALDEGPLDDGRDPEDYLTSRAKMLASLENAFDAKCKECDALRSDATPGGIEGAVADVRAFHLAAMEGNPHAVLRERTETPALVRAVSRYKLLREEYEEYVEAGVEGDVVGVLDALIDVIYVAIGTGLIQFGGDRFSRAWKAVHESNMAKRWPDGRFRIREDGKIEKPPGWVGPEIAAIVNGHSEMTQRETPTPEVEVRNHPSPFAGTRVLESWVGTESRRQE